MNTAASVPAVSGLSLSQRLVVAAFALVIGLACVGTVGFASDMRIHNGAHDARHSLGFPCH